MTDTETAKLTNEEIFDKKMRDLVQRNEHINFQKKGKLMESRIYWKKKYNKRGRNCHKKEDRIIKYDREEKYTNNNEIDSFIFIKETKSNEKN